ncbi:hypothetical protein BAY61_12995 [Prauserella marina]|uniref:Uncharacterized protein n=1 Tax=Prauserella marina TaxID=530584 RepID=A0A222VPB7_9PSEU|nr:DUF6346 domain-containing protein [Prauserella marina]ASR35766.1 hypothetical protein BAY61_12995 [Prauserella marina]PWV84339.1 hypothetical protein DES30_101356 [Prauserella marina]SDC24970.1 hypothetical protein SAMN05421630_101981 [Prauserella marina]
MASGSERSTIDAPDRLAEAARNPRTPPWREPWTSLPGVGRWAELPGRERFWRVTYVVSQLAVRALLALVSLTIAANTGVLSSDGVVTKRGSALATHCERVGPVSPSGLGWYWACEAEITWSDGETAHERFQNSALTPENLAHPKPVVYQSVRDAADQIVVDEPRPFVGLGYSLFVASVFAALYGVRIPGVPPMPADRRIERRRRVRLQWWQPLALPVGWGLVVAGGLGTVSSASAGGSVVVIVLGYLALVAGWFVSQGRRKRGVAEPTTLPPERVRRYGKAGRGLVVLGAAVAAGSAMPNLPDWPKVVSAVAVPLAVLAVGWRLTVVANRRSAEQVRVSPYDR